MSIKSVRDKIRRGVKDDSSLHEFYWHVRREREAKGLPPPEEDLFDPKQVFAEWRREHTAAKTVTWEKAAANNKRLLREFTICIDHAPAPADGYLAYCSAVNGKRMHGETVAEAQKKMTAYLADYLGKLAAQGKPLPKTGVRIKKIKIAAPTVA
jgi:predicted RNase H-like HicB family nuclease